jgi:hypothetical protein
VQIARATEFIEESSGNFAIFMLHHKAGHETRAGLALSIWLDSQEGLELLLGSPRVPGDLAASIQANRQHSCIYSRADQYWVGPTME